jgi:Recombination, repair and ssDNA binding protein UvsY
MTILDILKESKKDLPNIKKDQLIDEQARIPELFHKYHLMYRQIRIAKMDLEKTIKQMTKEKWEYYSGTAGPEVYKKKPFNVKLQTTEAKKRYVDADEELLAEHDKMKLLNEKEDTVTSIMKEIDNRRWIISGINKSMEFFKGDQV